MSKTTICDYVLSFPPEFLRFPEFYLVGGPGRREITECNDLIT